MSTKVVPRCNGSRKKIRQQHTPSQPGLELRAPPEQAQRESQHAVKRGASEHDDLIVELTKPLGGIGSLQQNGGLLKTKNLFGSIFLLADPLGRDPLAASWIYGFTDDPPAGVNAIRVIVLECLALGGNRIAGLWSVGGGLRRMTGHIGANAALCYSPPEQVVDY